MHPELVMSRGISTLHIMGKSEIYLSKEVWYGIVYVRAIIHQLQNVGKTKYTSKFSSTQQTCWRLCGEKDASYSQCIKILW